MSRWRASCMETGWWMGSPTLGLMFIRKAMLIAVASGGLRDDVRKYGRIANTQTALERLVRKPGALSCWSNTACGRPQRHGVQHTPLGTGHGRN
jgi:hypothetical protein